MKKYLVERYELHSCFYEVEADSPNEAASLVREGEGLDYRFLVLNKNRSTKWDTIDNMTTYIEVADNYEHDVYGPGIRSVEEII